VLDPHGDLIDKVLGYIPENRVSDVILLDPSDEDYPIGVNILSAHSEQEKTLLSSDLVAGFRRLSTSWGDQMTSVLGNAILAFLESEMGGTLADLRRFLVEKEFRQSFLETVNDREVVYYWQKEFPLLVGKPQGPLLTRLDTFLRPKLIRHMICQKENRLDFRKIMDEKKIFLAKLAQGTIGEENSNLLGTLIVSKIHQMTMGRQELAESKRQNFFLYIDEFHNFITPSMASILSGTRKYRLGLILAHQDLRQLWNKDTDVASAVISNPYTRICFRCGDFDAQKLKEGFSFFDSKDLQNLGTGQAIVRIEKAEYDFNLKTFPLPDVDFGEAQKRQGQIIANSRNVYGSRREEVERSLAIEETSKKEVEKSKAKAVPEKEESTKKSKESEGRELVIKDIVTMPVISTPGRGGEQHKFLQHLIKRTGEDRGFQVFIEKSILSGAGSVDVSLEKKERKIACEISVTTNEGQEIGNIQKCLAAGYGEVIIVSSEKKALNKISALANKELGSDLFKKTRFLLPEEMISYLETSEVNDVRGDPSLSENKEILTAKELESLLKIDIKTIYSYAQKGLLPYVKIQSNLRFVRSEILKWMAEHRFQPKSKPFKK
jgi:predicted DNA-binding transcriptional regulator AlpA